MGREKPAADSGRIYGGESAADRLARQRRQFMAAGLELFGTVGYRATTVRMLCKQAGLIDRYFYKNFTDTEDLLAAVYTESVDRIEAEVGEAIGPALASRDPGRRVRPERLLQGRRGLSSRSRVLAGNSRREPAGR